MTSQKTSRKGVLLDSNYCVIDFETRCKLPIGKGAYEYTKDPSLEVLCLCVKFRGSEPMVIYDKDKIKSMCKKVVNFSSKSRVIAHNSIFDFYVLRKVTNCSFAVFKNLVDSQLLSGYAGGPQGLDMCPTYFDLRSSKAPLGKTLIKILSIPYNEDTPKHFLKIKTSKYVAPNGFVEHPRILKHMGEYCKMDVILTEELYLKLERYTNKILSDKIVKDVLLNTQRNQRGIKVDREALKLIDSEFKKVRKWFSEKAKEITGLKNFNIYSSTQVLKYFRDNGKSIGETGELYLTRLYPNLKGSLKKLALLSITAPKNQGKKSENILSSLHGDRLKDNYKYFGAGRTGRYVTYCANILNVPRGDIDNFDERLKALEKGNFFETYKLESGKALSSMIRHTFVPANGIFYGVDFKQIDFRLLLLATGEYKILKEFYGGLDMYIWFAQKAYGRKKITDKERSVVKAVVLGFGYGNGVDAIYANLMLQGLPVNKSTIMQMKRTYHMMFRGVKPFWAKLEAEYNRTKCITVPFFKKRINLEYSRDRLWGAKLTGICIQSMTQLLFNWSIRNLHKKMKINPCIVFHDEIVIDTENVNEERFRKIVRQAPKCLPKEHFPYIHCEFWKGHRYK